MQALVHFFALLGTVSNTVLTLSIYGIQLKFIFVGLIVFNILVGALIFSSKSFGRNSSGFVTGKQSNSNSKGA